MTELFSSTPDKDGDYIDVDTSGNCSDELLFSVIGSQSNTWNGACLDRGEVIALRDVLDDWLCGYKAETTVTRTATAPPELPAYATEDRVRELIAEAVLPLHKSPQATEPDPDPHDVGHPDPDPHDVGHPDPAPEEMCNRVQPLQGVHPATRCTWCGFLWTDHPTFAEQLQKVSEAAAKVMAPYKQLLGCGCGHGWGVHSPDGCSAVHRPLGGALHQCTCTRTPPRVWP